MGYTVSWEQLAFSDVTYKIVTELVPTLINVKFRLERWGFVVGNNENDSLCIERYPTQMTFVKTNRLPYTKDVMKTLIIMVEYGAARDLHHDDINMTWFLEALEEIHAVSPLKSYYIQKAYFNSLHMKDQV